MSNSTHNDQLPVLGSGGRCVVCDKVTDMKCQGCVKAGKPPKYYCGKEHQQLDWKYGHKKICSASGNFIFQFKITLLGAEPPFIGPMIEPPIWRRIQLKKNSTFRDLHKAISLSMGWFESHLHEFRFPSELTIGIPNDDYFAGPKTIPEKKVKLSTHFHTEGTSCKYEYDFGDGWIHEVLLEKIMQANENATYPVCVDGRRACPPEDCGGPYGYAELLATFAKPANRRKREEREKLDWLENHPYGYANFDPDRFEREAIKWEMFNSSIWGD